MTPSLEATFLTKEQLFEETALKIVKLYGRQTGLTDLAILLGGDMGFAATVEKDRSGFVWSASSSSYSTAFMVCLDGSGKGVDTFRRDVSARPAVSLAMISAISSSTVKELELPNTKKVQICEFGEYPQTIVSDVIAQSLESLYSINALKTTDNKYTFDCVGLKEYDTPFKASEHFEYELDGHRYIRLKGKPRDSDSVLSNGQSAQEEKIYWIEVQPIEWLVDETGILVAKKGLFSGIQFDTKKRYAGDFSQTAIKSFMDNYFVPEMMQSVLGSSDRNKVIAELKEMTVAGIWALPQNDPKLLKKLIIVGGLLEEAIDVLTYEQKKAIYSKIYKELSPDVKQKLEQSILTSRNRR